MFPRKKIGLLSPKQTFYLFIPSCSWISQFLCFFSIYFYAFVFFSFFFFSMLFRLCFLFVFSTHTLLFSVSLNIHRTKDSFKIKTNNKIFILTFDYNSHLHSKLLWINTDKHSLNWKTFPQSKTKTYTKSWTSFSLI